MHLCANYIYRGFSSGIHSQLYNYYTGRSVLSIISGPGFFGVRPHAKKTRLPRFIEMILAEDDKTL
jgi:hypothetical protein